MLCVKGSGHDMATLPRDGFAAVRLAPLRKLLAREDVADADMVRVMRANLIDPMAPNPSVETMLHACLPHAYVDHTHATAVLSLTDQPNGRELCAEVFGGRIGHVPYHRPGFGLAKLAAKAFAANPRSKAWCCTSTACSPSAPMRANPTSATSNWSRLRRGAPAQGAQGGVRLGATAAAGRRGERRSRRSCAAPAA